MLPRKDARDLVVLAVGFAYLQAVADQARIATVQAQVETATAINRQASDQVKAGTSPAIDGLRAKVELQHILQLLQASRSTPLARYKARTVLTSMVG